MRKCKKLIGFLCFALVLCGCSKVVDNYDLIQFGVRDVNFELKPGEKFQQSYWNEDQELIYTDNKGNEERHKGKGVLKNSVCIGSSVQDLINAYDIQEQGAIVNREIDTTGDGTTEVIEEAYKNLEFFEQEKVLDAMIIFGYEKKDDKWTKLTYDALKEVTKDDSNGTITNDGTYLIFKCDFVGGALASETEVAEKCMISFEVTYR